MNIRRSRLIVLVISILLIAIVILWLVVYPSSRSTNFDGQRAYQDVIKQVSFGPRVPGSQAHADAIAYIQQQLSLAGWETQIQNITWQGFEVENILASNSENEPRIILGAHYDSRMLADQDSGAGRNSPVPGANDGASGVAALLELARTIPKKSIPIGLVFFDAEDDGGLDGRDWLMGSRAFVSELTYRPEAVIVLDMIGDKNLDIYIESNSTLSLVTEIWGTAARLGYADQFIQTPKYSMEDDHTPFLEAGIPAVDIIDFDYPYWHTTSDTPDKVSPASLKIVGDTLLTWIKNK